VTFANLLVLPVTIVQRSAQPEGGYGEDVFVETGRIDTRGYLRPLSGFEDLTQQATTRTQGTLFLAATDPLSADDQVVIDGQTWEVTAVGLWRNPRTRQDHHVEATVELVVG
jgi:hypothetical protein